MAMAHRPKFSPTNRMPIIMVPIPFQSLYLTEMRMTPSRSISPSIQSTIPSVISGDTSGVLNEDSSVTGDLNATDIEGLTDGSYFSISSAATNGTSSIDATDGNWTYSPYSNFYGPIHSRSPSRMMMVIPPPNSLVLPSIRSTILPSSQETLPDCLMKIKLYHW